MTQTEEASHYAIMCGSDEPIILIGYGMAVEFMCDTIAELRLPKWREQALLQQAENMPRAGFSFTDNNGDLIKVERVR